jgi:hypothetical protein
MPPPPPPSSQYVEHRQLTEDVKRKIEQAVK